MIRRRLLVLCVAALVFLNTPAGADESLGWAMGEHARARIMPVAVDPASTDKTKRAALLEIRLSEGWHTYWKVPGDSGLPPRFDWSGSKNLEDVKIFWPFPKRYNEFDLQVFGYKNELDLPLSLTAESPDNATDIALKLDLMVCHEICIPETLTLKALVPPAPEGEAGTFHNRRLYDFKMETVPQAEQTPDLEIKTVTLGPEALVINAFSKQGFAHADIFATSGDVALTAVPEVTPDKSDSRLAMIRISKPPEIEDLSLWMQGRELTITFVAERGAIEKTIAF